MQSVLIVIHILIVIALIAVVLLQRSENAIDGMQNVLVARKSPLRIFSHSRCVVWE